MNEKTKAIIYLIIFVIAIVGISIFLNYNSKIRKQETVGNQITPETEKSAILEISESNFEEEVLKSNKKVLVDFYATWCIPCRILKPRINEVANEHPEIKVVSIDIDKAPNISEKYSVYSIPTLVVIENGKEISRIVGAVEKNKILELCNLK